MFFSIIIPLYNKAPYVEKALRSVAAQTFTDYELIVVDDGSKDDSAAIAEKCIKDFWQDRPQPVKLIRQANAGVSTARNNGVAASRGKYVCFLDADDWWGEPFLEEMTKLIAEFSDAGIYGTNYTIVNETKHKTRIAPIGVEKGFEKGYINYCQVYAKSLCMPLTSTTVAMPRSVFEEMKGFKPDLKLGEDFVLWVHIALKHKVVFLNKPLAFYNQDVDVVNRGTQHLHQPKYHMLWNLSDLEDEEERNSDYKQLVDRLRVNGLMRYYLSKEYHDAAVAELKKVDWDKQPMKYKRLYRMPVWLLRTKNDIEKQGAKLKQLIRKCVK